MTQYDTPPTEPGLMTGEMPGWPKVIGIISIVWASIGLTCNVLGLGWYAVAPWVLDMAKDQMGPVPSQMLATPPLWILMGVGLIWTVLLMTAGIMTIRRNPGGRPLHLVWAAGAILIGALGTYFNHQMQADLVKWAAEHPDSGWAKQVSPTGNMIGLLIGVVFTIAWPGFCLVWFGLVKKKPEDMTGGLGPEPDLV